MEPTKETEEENITPIEKSIKEFERLKSKADTVRDMVYLDGVMAVLDSMKEYEKTYHAAMLKQEMPSEEQMYDSFCEHYSHYLEDGESVMTLNAFKKAAIELLTKGCK